MLRTLRFLALLTLLAPACAAWAQEPPLNKSLNESVIFVPHGSGVKLETTIFKPDGAGPFPLAVRTTAISTIRWRSACTRRTQEPAARRN